VPQPATCSADRLGVGLGVRTGQIREAVGTWDEAAVPLGSGGGRRGCRSAGVAPQLEQVVGAAQQFPLGVAGAPAATQEPPGALLLFNLAEDRLDGLPPFGVARLAVLALSLAVIAARSPSLRDADGLPSLRGLPWRACLAGGMYSSGALGIAVTFSIDQYPESASAASGHWLIPAAASVVAVACSMGSSW
jgi:hypothetical protein